MQDNQEFLGLLFTPDKVNVPVYLESASGGYIIYAPTNKYAASPSSEMTDCFFYKNGVCYSEDTRENTIKVFLVNVGDMFLPTFTVFKEFSI